MGEVASGGVCRDHRGLWLVRREKFVSQLPVTPALAVSDSELAEMAIHPESFWGVVVRRSRYVVAIAASAAVMLYVARPLVSPPPELAGLSLVAWPGHGGIVGAAVLTGVLVACILLSMILCHPDSPHIGIYCALLGLGALAIRGGNIHLMVYSGQTSGRLAAIHKLLALECVQWAVIIIVCEVAIRLFYERLFSNLRWLDRSGLSRESVEKMGHKVGGSVGGFAVSLWLLALTRKSGDKKPNQIIQNVIAILATVIVASGVLYVFMQSQNKGQVLFALYVSFALGGGLGRAAAPHCDLWALMLAVPLTAALGYLSASTHMQFPGESASILSRALPVDYICAGVPAVIFGYYTALRIQFRHALDAQT